MSSDGLHKPFTDTHCPYCALQCGMTLHRDGASAARVEARNFPTNRGGLCRKGWTCAQLLELPERLTTPLLRDPLDNQLKPASWERAIEHICSHVSAIQRRVGHDGISLYGGGGLTNEKAYALGKFARAVLKTRYIDYNGRFCMAAAAVAAQMAFGIDRGLPFPLQDISSADVVLIAGSNPASTMPPIMQYFDALREQGGKLVVSDPRLSATAVTADLHLQPVPGTDLALFNGLLFILIRDKHIDEAFIENHTGDFSGVRRVVRNYWPDRVERLTGVPTAKLEQAATLLGAADRLIVLSGRGIEQQCTGVDNDLALINLVLALGQAGKPGCGYGCLTGQGNGQGGREHGQKADQLPGYRSLDDPVAREWVASVWGVDAASLPPPGLSACEMFELFGEQIHALLVFAANPVVSAPDAIHFRERITRLDLLVVCDSFLSETANCADVVLPVTQWAEELGTMTNLEGRVILRTPLQPPPEGVLSDLEVMARIAQGLGYQGVFATEPEVVFNELRRASKGGIADYSGISYARISAEQGVFWPCPDEQHPGTPRLFETGFYTADGRARFHPVDYSDSAEATSDEYPLFVTTGRLALQVPQKVWVKRSASGTLNERSASSPCSQRKAWGLWKALVAYAAPRALRQRAQWQLRSSSRSAASSQATRPHRQLPRAQPGSLAFRSGGTSCGSGRPGGRMSKRGRSSAISCQGALEAAKMCATGRAPGSSSSAPAAMMTRSPVGSEGVGEPQRWQNGRSLPGEVA